MKPLSVRSRNSTWSCACSDCFVERASSFSHQLFLVIQHRLAQPRNLLSKHVNLGSEQRKLFFPRNLLGSFLSCNPCTNSFQHLLWQPERLQKWEENRRVSQTLMRRRHRPSGHHFRRRLTSASMEAPQYPFRRIDRQPLVAWLSRIVRLPRGALATTPAYPRRTAPVTTLPRRPAPTHATRLAHPLPRNLGLPAHTHTATEIGTHVELSVPYVPKTSQRVTIPKLPRPGRKHPHGPQT